MPNVILEVDLERAKAVLEHIAYDHLPYGERGRLVNGFFKDLAGAVAAVEPDYDYTVRRPKESSAPA
jgi:hypothetical protein